MVFPASAPIPPMKPTRTQMANLTLQLLVTLTLGCSSLLAQTSLRNLQADIEYKTTPQGPLLLDLYGPDSKSRKPGPLVVYTHGGGWAAGSKDGAKAGSMRGVVEGLVANGFCVASVDYRLYTQDGDVTIKDCVTDCKDAVRYLVKHADELGIDPQRVFTFGDSAGGQIAQMLLLTPPALFPGDPGLADADYTMIAGVSWYGPCDFEKTELFNHDGRADFRDRFGPRILPPGSDPKDTLRLYREMSPVNYLKPDSPPLLMIQGDQDTTIPVHHARYMKERAEAIRAPVEITLVENAGHNWREVGAPIRPTRDEIVAMTVDFFVKHLEAKP